MPNWPFCALLSLENEPAQFLLVYVPATCFLSLIRACGKEEASVYSDSTFGAEELFPPTRLLFFLIKMQGGWRMITQWAVRHQLPSPHVQACRECCWKTLFGFGHRRSVPHICFGTRRRHSSSFFFSFWNDGTLQHERDGQAQPQNSITLEERLISSFHHAWEESGGSEATHVIRWILCGRVQGSHCAHMGYRWVKGIKTSILCFSGPFPVGPLLYALWIKWRCHRCTTVNCISQETIIEVEVRWDQGLTGTALIDLQDPLLRIRGRPGVVFIYYSELHGSFLSLCVACSVFGPVWLRARPRLRPHLDAIPPLKPMPKYPSRYSLAGRVQMRLKMKEGWNCKTELPFLFSSSSFTSWNMVSVSRWLELVGPI